MTALSVEVFREPAAEWRAFENALEDSGCRIPLSARSEWAAAAAHPVWLIGVRDGATPVDGVAVEITASRAAPLYRLWRVERLGGPGNLAAKIAACEEVARLARHHRVLRVSMEIIDRDPRQRRELADALDRIGLTPSDAPRNYTATSVIALDRSEDDLLASMRPTARRHLRATERLGFRVVRLDDPRWVPSIERVAAETWQRTGGRMPATDWGAIMRASRAAPHCSVIYGLLNSPEDGEGDRLLAFGWGCQHGDHAHYASGGSVRFPRSSPPLTYALIWALMQWAARNGAAWFDLGGVPVSPGDDEAGRRLQDIARFKRGFGGTEQEVAEEWTLSPHPTVARIAGAVGAVARRFSR